jgi:hypothetical protein
MTYLARAQSVPARDEDAARVSDLWDQVDSVFPGARLTARRTPGGFKCFWDELTRQADARRRAETIATAQLEQWRRRHTPVATETPPMTDIDETRAKRLGWSSDQTLPGGRWYRVRNQIAGAPVALGLRNGERLRFSA